MILSSWEAGIAHGINYLDRGVVKWTREVPFTLVYGLYLIKLDAVLLMIVRDWN